MAKKQLITEAHVMRARAAGRKLLEHAPDAIVTPLARDASREQGIELVPMLPARNTSESARTGSTAPPRSIAVGSDHGGFEFKQELVRRLKDLGWSVVDVGTDSARSVDYPEFAYAVAREVGTGRCRLGMMIDGVGVGSAMACNKVPGIRAACAASEFAAWNARAHNDANILTLGSRVLGIEVAWRIVQTFLETDFEGGRHAKRVDMIGDIETRYLADR